MSSLAAWFTCRTIPAWTYLAEAGPFNHQPVLPDRDKGERISAIRPALSLLGNVGLGVGQGNGGLRHHRPEESLMVPSSEAVTSAA